MPKETDKWEAMEWIPHVEQMLQKLAIWVLELVAHAGGVEGLFLNMAATKTKSCKRMDPNSSKNSSSLALSQDPESNSDNEFDGPDALKEFKAGVFPISMVDQVEGLLYPTLELEDGYIQSLLGSCSWGLKSGQICLDIGVKLYMAWSKLCDESD
ncbi:hypothetical protein DFH28DRAFT_1141012 [Melampsora americana]|nr:hypothetical protein DFH28DRAFT_1141012 [Melampsora americana]